MARALTPPPAPLFIWQAKAEAARLEQLRVELKGRIVALPRHSHRRVVLEARLADITARQLKIETSGEDRS